MSIYDDDDEISTKVASEFFPVGSTNYDRLVKAIKSAIEDRDQEWRWEMMGEDL